MNSPRRLLPPGYDVSVPTMKRGIAAIVCMGLYTLAVGWSTMQLLDNVDRDGDDIAWKSLAMSVLYMAVTGLAAWLTLCLWMSRAKEAVDQRGFTGPTTWKIWLAWFVPLYSIVAPCLVMSDLMVRKRTVWTRLAMIGWWGGWVTCVYLGQFSFLFTADDATERVAQITQIAMMVSYVGVVCVVLLISRDLDRPYKIRNRAGQKWVDASA